MVATNYYSNLMDNVQVQLSVGERPNNWKSQAKNIKWLDPKIDSRIGHK